MPTFTFTTPIEYTDWRGRDRSCDATFTYTFDGTGHPVCTSALAHSDDAEAKYAADAIADDLCADRCDDDFADWLAERIAA